MSMAAMLAKLFLLWNTGAYSESVGVSSNVRSIYLVTYFRVMIYMLWIKDIYIVSLCLFLVYDISM